MKVAPASKGDQTRQALVQAATQIIGKVGFDAASTRAISQQAGVNQALINYHFGGKDELYQAVISAITDQLELSLEPVLDQLDASMPLRGGNAVAALVKIFSTLIDQFSLAEMQDWSRIVSREQQDPTPAFEIIYARFMERLLSLISVLITGASGGKVTGDAARVRAVLFIGQIMVFVYAPATAHRFLEWPVMDKKQQKKIVRQFEAIVQSQFPGDEV